MKKHSIILFYIILLGMINLNNSMLSQNFQYKNCIYEQKEKLKKKNFLVNKKPVDITAYLPKNYIKDGSIDYTKYIQIGLNENRIVQMPDFPVLINKNGLQIQKESIIIFSENSVLLMAPNSSTNYAILKIDNVNNIVILSPKIIGERLKHLGKTGEWGMGISILNSQNIKICNAQISNCWGDGIYIGRNQKFSTNDNIEIDNCKIDNCRRNGISIVDGKNIKIENPIISNINGTPPESGIDIEPNDNQAIINNIVIKRPTTFNNHGTGIMIYLNNLLGVYKKDVNINISGHTDNGSNNGFFIGEFKDRKNNTEIKSITGKIEISNSQWLNNKKTIIVGSHIERGPKLIFDGITTNSNASQITKTSINLVRRKNVFLKSSIKQLKEK